jgi:hypothetical protein
MSMHERPARNLLPGMRRLSDGGNTQLEFARVRSSHSIPCTNGSGSHSSAFAIRNDSNEHVSSNHQYGKTMNHPSVSRMRHSVWWMLLFWCLRLLRPPFLFVLVFLSGFRLQFIFFKTAHGRDQIHLKKPSTPPINRSSNSTTNKTIFPHLSAPWLAPDTMNNMNSVVMCRREYGKLYSTSKITTTAVLDWIRSLSGASSALGLNAHINLAQQATDQGILMPPHIINCLQTAISTRIQISNHHATLGEQDERHENVIAMLGILLGVFKWHGIHQCISNPPFQVNILNSMPFWPGKKPFIQYQDQFPPPPANYHPWPTEYSPYHPQPPASYPFARPYLYEPEIDFEAMPEPYSPQYTPPTTPPVPYSPTFPRMQMQYPPTEHMTEASPQPAFVPNYNTGCVMN